MSRAIATLAGIGRLPGAPGTWGSLATLPIGYLLHLIGGFPLVLLGIVAAMVAGLWAVAALTRGEADPDRSEIVIDEAVGQLIALAPLSAGLWMAGAPAWVFPWPGWVGAFLAFRLFDIWKPWPVSTADRLKTPLGVMLDDVLAGIYAALCVMAAAAVAHGGLGL